MHLKTNQTNNTMKWQIQKKSGIIKTYGLHYPDIRRAIFLLKIVNWITLQINKSQVVAAGRADIQGSIYFVVF